MSGLIESARHTQKWLVMDDFAGIDQTGEEMLIYAFLTRT
jgi:hypothetical protein